MIKVKLDEGYKWNSYNSLYRLYEHDFGNEIERIVISEILDLIYVKIYKDGIITLKLTYSQAYVLYHFINGLDYPVYDFPELCFLKDEIEKYLFQKSELGFQLIINRNEHTR